MARPKLLSRQVGGIIEWQEDPAQVAAGTQQTMRPVMALEYMQALEDAVVALSGDGNLPQYLAEHCATAWRPSTVQLPEMLRVYPQCSFALELADIVRRHNQASHSG